MKKTFFKSVVATAVVTAAMALSSVAAFADGDTYTYNMDDLLSDTKAAALDIDVLNYGTSTSSSYYISKTIINEGDTHEITILGNANPILIDYAEDETYMQSNATTGSLSGTKLDRAIYTQAGVSKDIITIDSVKAGYTVEVYFAGTESSGKPTKANSMSIKDAGSKTQTLTADSNSTSTPTYDTFKVTTTGTVTISTTGSRIAVFAIVITPSVAAEEGTITYAANNSAAGTIELSDGDKTYTSGSTFDGDTELTLTAKANDGYIVDDIIADGASIMNSDGSTASISVDGSMTVTVMFKKVITAAITLDSDDFTATSENVFVTGLSTNTPENYSFSGQGITYDKTTYNSASVNVMRVSQVSTTSTTTNLIFKTGTLPTNGLAMRITYAAGGSDEDGRQLQILNVSTGNLTSYDGSTSTTDFKTSDAYTLTADTEYKIGSVKSNLFLVSVEIYEPSSNGLTKTNYGGIYVLDDDTYVIAGVSTSALENDNLYVTVGGKTFETSTVYTAVKISDAVTVEASQIDANYLYAIKITDANGYPNVDFTTSFTES